MNTTKHGRSVSSPLLWGAALALCATASACSFLLDFPDQSETSVGGSGGTGAGTTGGGGEGGDGGSGPPPICEEFAPEPGFDKVALQIVMDNLDNTLINTTGLARDEDSGLLHAYGQTTGGIADGFTPAHQFARELFMFSKPDVGDATLTFSAQSCEELNEAASGRIALFADGRQVIGGASASTSRTPRTGRSTPGGTTCARRRRRSSPGPRRPTASPTPSSR